MPVQVEIKWVEASGVKVQRSAAQDVPGRTTAVNCTCAEEGPGGTCTSTFKCQCWGVQGQSTGYGAHRATDRDEAVDVHAADRLVDTP